MTLSSLASDATWLVISIASDVKPIISISDFEISYTYIYYSTYKSKYKISLVTISILASDVK